MLMIRLNVDDKLRPIAMSGGAVVSISVPSVKNKTLIITWGTQLCLYTIK